MFYKFIVWAMTQKERMVFWAVYLSFLAGRSVMVAPR